MSSEQQGVITSSPSSGTSNPQTSYDCLNDATNAVNKIANGYDAQYTELCNTLEDVAATVEYIKQHRMTNISALRDDIEQLVNAIETARKSAADNDTLKGYLDEMQRLEREKRQLQKEIVDGKEEEKQLQNKLHHVEQQMDSTRHEREAIKNQKESEVPSLEYMKRVLHRLSQVYLTSKGDSMITQGFVSKNGTNDVRPFRFDDSTSQFAQVNKLWDIISEECY